MKKPILVILAAGMGSRYGGLKQIDPVGNHGQIILDYSIYDALRAGFGKVVLIIKEEMREAVDEIVERGFGKAVKTEYVYQRLDDIPPLTLIPPDRVKPWGTSHAVNCARNKLDGPFAVANADDFYGLDAFVKIAGFLGNAPEDGALHCCMAGYELGNTVTEHGHVARGVCEVDGTGLLKKITERTRIEIRDGSIVYIEGDGATPLPPNTTVSMNLWGFPQGVLPHLESKVEAFFRGSADLRTAEFYLPSCVDLLLQDGLIDVSVLRTTAKWFGMTYQKDKAEVKAAIASLTEQGGYPDRLW